MLQIYASKLKAIITTLMSFVIPLCTSSRNQFAHMQICNNYNHLEQILLVAECLHKFALHMKKRHRHNDVLQV